MAVCSMPWCRNWLPATNVVIVVNNISSMTLNSLPQRALWPVVSVFPEVEILFVGQTHTREDEINFLSCLPKVRKNCVPWFQSSRSKDTAYSCLPYWGTVCADDRVRYVWSTNPARFNLVLRQDTWMTRATHCWLKDTGVISVAKLKSGLIENSLTYRSLEEITLFCSVNVKSIVSVI